MKVIHKPQRPVPLIKVNQTPKGGDHPIKRNHPIKDSKFFKNKRQKRTLIKNKTKKVKSKKF
jgi:hypothetical protein